MKKKLLTMFAAMALLMPIASQAKVEHLLPKPQQITVTQNVSAFMLGRNVTIAYGTGVEQCELLEEFFTENGCTIADGGAAVTVNLVESIPGAYDYDLYGYENEAYTLQVSADEIVINAITNTGVIRAAQTLTQLAEGYEGTAAIEALTMKDWPAFKLRGYMHDVGRSFISIDELIKQVEKFSRFKVNTFHWHMTENQAWRFEVKAYPALTSTESMTRFAGKYYTQEDCKRLLAVAKKHGMIVVPEIDMPGHSEAFVRAMGFGMQTDEGKVVLKKVLDEVCEVFADAPYIHIGGDEVSTTAAYLNEMIAYVESKGKKTEIWNPINGIGQDNLNAGLAQMWGTRGYLASGKANIDSRYNYTNHFDVFADLVGIYKSNVYYSQKGNKEVAGAVSGCWNDRKTATEKDIIAQNNVWANVIATAERTWIGGGKQYIDNCNNAPSSYTANGGGGGVMLPNSGEEYEEFADWERRFLFHKANSLKGEPIPYVKQTNVRWRITDAFPNGGSETATFGPEEAGISSSMDKLPETYTLNGQTYYTGMATGAGIYLSHTWGNSIIKAYYENPQYNHTAYAWTYVYSPKKQTVGAQIEFQNYSRSEQDGAPASGKWDHFGSKIWINGKEIAAPTYANTGVGINKEVDLKNENFPGREPIKVTLNEGWNKVFLKLPYFNKGYRLKKWMFTCVFTDTKGVDAVEGLIYSPNQCMDEATETVAAKVSEMKRNRGALIGTAVGLWPESAAQSLDEKIKQVEATYNEEKTAEEREAQVAELTQAWKTFEASLTGNNMNVPENGKYYRMYTPLRASRYATSNGVGEAITGPTEATTKASIWEFVSRGDGSYDIVNLANGSYIATSGSPLKSVEARPSKGWNIKPAAKAGNVIVVSGSAQFNQQKDGSYQLLNWGSGTNTTDDGCQYRIVDVTETVPPQPIAQVEELATKQYPHALTEELEDKIFAAENLTIALDVKMGSQINLNQAFICASDTSVDSNNATFDNTSTFVAVGMQGGKVRYYASAKSDGYYTAKTAQLTASQSHKVVIVIDKTNNTRTTYVDGVAASLTHFQDFNHFKDNDNANIYIGGGVTSAGNKYTFSGNVRSALFFDSALSSEKVAMIEYPVSEDDIALSDAVVANGAMNPYGLQKFLGLVQNAGTGINGDGQFVCNYPANTSQESGNAYANLIDNNYETFFHSGYDASIGEGAHYLQANLSKTVKNFRFYFKKRKQNNANRPTKITIEGSNDGSAWTKVKVVSSGLPTDESVLDYYSEEISCSTAYKQFRFTVNGTSNSTVFYTFSEFYILPNTTKVAETFDAVRNYRAEATVETAKALNTAYAWNKGLTEGSPIVGVEEYAYVDTYKDGAFLNRYMYNNNGSLTLTTELQKNADKFIWTPSLDESGKYSFANKAGKYLAHKGMSDSKHLFTVATSTHHHGVTLHTQGSNYFVVKNADGGFDQSSITYDQTSTAYCTDFVFVPTDIYEGMLTLSVVSNTALANAVFSWNGIDITESAAALVHSGETVADGKISLKSCNPAYVLEGIYSDAAYTNKITEVTSLTNDMTIYAKFDLNIFSENYGDKWVRFASCDNGSYWATVEQTTANGSGKTIQLDYTDEKQLWCLVGNANEFVLYNKAAGSELALNVVTSKTSYAEGDLASLTSARGTWKLKAQSFGYALVPTAKTNSSNMGINMWGGTGGYLKLYATASTNKGSYWTVQLADVANPLTIAVEVSGTQPYATNTKVANLNASIAGATSTSVIKGSVEAMKYYLPVGEKFTMRNDFTYRGYVFDGLKDAEGNVAEYENVSVPQGGLQLTASYSVDEDNKYQYLFYNRHEETGKPYRIPAIALASDSTVLAFTDYRPCSNDIGYGEVDIMLRRSNDNGQTWTDAQIVADGKGGSTNVYNVGFGDAAVVADRESGEVLVMCVGGKQVFSWGSATGHNAMVKVVSHDNGKTWDAPVDVTNQFMTQSTSLFPGAYTMFFGSGRMVQSRVYKAEGADYYRIYGALLIKHASDTWTGNCNFVVYSDDFGATWNILGGSIDKGMCCNGGDEPKVEELPDGTIILSSRKYSGRYFNVFTYSDMATGQGSWANAVSSNNQTNGLSFGGNATNGEIYLVKAVGVEDGKTCDIMLQSVPAGNGRSHVSVYYKKMDYSASYTPTTFSQNWTKGVEVTSMGSAYSTMILQTDGNFGFLYEEHPGDNYSYCIVYVPMSLEQLTGGKYSLWVDPTTGITEMETGKEKPENCAIFDLSGRHVQNAQKGIFIQNGKKMIK